MLIVLTPIQNIFSSSGTMEEMRTLTV